METGSGSKKHTSSHFDLKDLIEDSQDEKNNGVMFVRVREPCLHGAMHKAQTFARKTMSALE